MESAAHNPGLPPFQAAVVSGIVAGCLPAYEQVSSTGCCTLAYSTKVVRWLCIWLPAGPGNDQLTC